MTCLEIHCTGSSMKGTADIHSGKGKSNPTNTMRKYQQLALAVISIISLVAFLFYKHEYDRLRYTLEYLEMFGSPPAEDDVALVASRTSCGSNVFRRLKTAPPSWVKVSSDLSVYSAFWDEGNGYTKPEVRAIGVIKSVSRKPQFELKAMLWYEGSSNIINSECSLERIQERLHAKLSPSNSNGLTLVYMICQSDIKEQKSPLALQFKPGIESSTSSLLLIQESKPWKSVANITAVCAFNSGSLSSTLTIIEFVAFYNSIGVEKFIFFGPVLTPLARELLDKYSDEIGIFYEEFSFNVPSEFPLTSDQMRSIVEKDCIFRHRDTHENIFVLQLNQFLLPKGKSNSIQDILNMLPSFDDKPTSTVSEFHFESQRVCVDLEHSSGELKSDLILDSNTRMVATKQEQGIAMIRPHLTLGFFVPKASSGVSNEQHIPGSVAVVYNFESACTAGDQTHEDISHLPTVKKFTETIKKSLLYRKWKINS